MWYQPEIVSPVSAEPVTLGMAKQQCRAEIYDDDGNITASVDDPLFELLITSARDHAEKICGRFFAPCEIEAYCDDFTDLARFDVSPVTEIVSISYVSPAGDDETLSASTYELRVNGMDASVVLKSGNSWPSRQTGSRIKVGMKVGTSSPPPTVLRAMLLLIGAWYENREETVIGVSIGELPTYVSVDALLCNNRRFL